MPQGYTAVTGNQLTDASGNVARDGTITFLPLDPTGARLLAISIDGGAQTATTNAVSTRVVDGEFSLPLADTSLTIPPIAYRVTVIDNATGNSLLGPGYLIQPTGPTWDFDQYEVGQQ